MANEIKNKMNMSELCAFTGLQSRTVENYIQDGVIQATLEKNKRYFQTFDSLYKLYKFFRDRYLRRGDSKTEQELKEEKLRVETELKKTQEAKHKLDIDILTGKYIKLENFMQDLNNANQALKSVYDQLPQICVSTVQVDIDLSAKEARQLEQKIKKKLDQEMLRWYNKLKIENDQDKEKNTNT